MSCPPAWYTTLRHTGPYDGLVASNAALQQLGGQQGIRFDSWDSPDGTGIRRGRAEHYLTNPAAEPDPGQVWKLTSLI